MVMGDIAFKIAFKLLIFCFPQFHWSPYRRSGIGPIPALALIELPHKDGSGRLLDNEALHRQNQLRSRFWTPVLAGPHGSILGRCSNR